MMQYFMTIYAHYFLRYTASVLLIYYRAYNFIGASEIGQETIGSSYV